MRKVIEAAGDVTRYLMSTTNLSVQIAAHVRSGQPYSEFLKIRNNLLPIDAVVYGLARIRLQ